MKQKLFHYIKQGARGEDVSCYSFLTSVLDGVSGQRHAPVMLYPRERTLGTHCTGGWVGLRAGLDTEDRGKILRLCRGSNPGRSVCSQTVVPQYADYRTFTWKSTGMRSFLYVISERRNHFRDLDLGERIILKWILRKQDVRMWTGFMWLRVASIE
jgi:hypothetical protein